MLTIVLATDDSSRRPTRHLCSFPPPLRLKILNIMDHFWLVRGNCHIEEFNFATLLFWFDSLSASPPSAPKPSLAPPVWHDVNPSLYSPTDLTTLLTGIMQFPSAGTFCKQLKIVKWKLYCWFQITTAATQVNIICLPLFSCSSQNFTNTEVISYTPQPEILRDFSANVHLSVHF